MKNIKLILFDWHGVLDEMTYTKFLERVSEILGGKVPVSQIADDLQEVSDLAIAGKIPDEKFWSTVQEKYGLLGTSLEFAQEAILGFKPNETLWRYLPTLAKKYKLGILSNCPADKGVIVKKETKAFPFSLVCLSCESGITKSDKNFFSDAAQGMGFSPEEILYVDDSETHIENGASLGFQTYHFTNAEEFLDMIWLD